MQKIKIMLNKNCLNESILCSQKELNSFFVVIESEVSNELVIVSFVDNLTSDEDIVEILREDKISFFECL